MLQSVIGVTGYDVAKFAVRADCGPSYCGAGRAAGYDVGKFAVRADCGPSYCGAGRGGLRAQISSPRRALIDTYQNNNDLHHVSHKLCKLGVQHGRNNSDKYVLVHNVERL